MMRRNVAKTAVVLLTASLLLPSFVPAETQAKAKIRLNYKKLNLQVGQQKKLKVKGTKKKVVWKSSKKKTATVSKKGVVKAIKKGTAKITAKVGEKKLYCTILYYPSDQSKGKSHKHSDCSGKRFTKPDTADSVTITGCHCFAKCCSDFNPNCHSGGDTFYIHGAVSDRYSGYSISFSGNWCI